MREFSRATSYRVAGIAAFRTRRRGAHSGLAGLIEPPPSSKQIQHSNSKAGVLSRIAGNHHGRLAHGSRRSRRVRRTCAVNYRARSGNKRARERSRRRHNRPCLLPTRCECLCWGSALRRSGRVNSPAAHAAASLAPVDAVVLADGQGYCSGRSLVASGLHPVRTRFIWLMREGSLCPINAPASPGLGAPCWPPSPR